MAEPSQNNLKGSDSQAQGCWFDSNTAHSYTAHFCCVSGHRAVQKSWYLVSSATIVGRRHEVARWRI